MTPAEIQERVSAIGVAVDEAARSVTTARPGGTVTSTIMCYALQFEFANLRQLCEALVDRLAELQDDLDQKAGDLGDRVTTLEDGIGDLSDRIFVFELEKERT